MSLPEYVFRERLPTPMEYNFLREQVGWKPYEIAVLERALPNTLFCLCVYSGDAIVGMGRVVGDGGLCFYIQDVIVLPAHQGRGLGGKIMTALMAYVDSEAHNNTIVGLMSALGKEPFYEKFGFFRRPAEKFGCGMTQFIRREPERDGATRK